MTVFGATGLIAIVLTVAACGGGGGAVPDGGGGGAGTGAIPGTPVAQCMAAETALCKRSTTCADAGATDEAACLAELKVVFGCELANTSFTECLTDINTVSCSTLQTLFSGSCGDPFYSIPLSPPQAKCAALVVALCTWSERCEGVTWTADERATCQDQVFADLDCRFAATVKEQCTADLPAAACASPDAGADAPSTLPASCQGAVTHVAL